MPFLQEPEPIRGQALQVLPGIRRIVARNPGVMTYRGTNTYLIDGPGGITVIDPGPEDAQHVTEILQAAGPVPIKNLYITHSHSDHVGAADALKQATGAPVLAYKISGKPDFSPDIAMNDGDTIGPLTAIFTPGHAVDHLCYQYHLDNGTKILFSGDHVMSWSSSIVSPAGGNMADYYRSLELLLHRDDALYLGGHGPTLADPRVMVAELLAHRKTREAGILAELTTQVWGVAALAGKLYHKTDLSLKIAAERNVMSHILKLVEEGRAIELDPEAAPAEPEPAADPSIATVMNLAFFKTEGRRRFSAIAV